MATCVFGVTKPYSDGFPLRRTSNAAKPSRNFRCSQLIKDLLPLDVELPMRGIAPLFINHQDYQLAWVLQEPDWIIDRFNNSRIQQIPADIEGFYELLNHAHKVLRIGEGSIKTRMKDHLRNEEFTESVESFRYYPLKSEKARLIMQEVRFAMFGGLPPLNKRRI